MATRRQEIKHKLMFMWMWVIMEWIHFYMPIRDIFRGMWWKAWGHDPKDPEFHLSQINFGGRFGKKIEMVASFFKLAEIFYGSPGNAFAKSKSLQLITRWDDLKYIPYDYFMMFEDILNPNYTAGTLIIETFLKIEGISRSALKDKVITTKGGPDTYNRILTIDFYPQESSDE
jgi:hypothetical protein